MKLQQLAIAVLLAASTFAMAQDGPPPGGPGGPGGPPPMMGRGGFRPMDNGMLLRRQDVQKELKITEAQRVKLREILDSMRPPGGPGGPGGPGIRGQGGPGGPGGPGMDPKMQKQLEEQRAKTDKALAKVLDEGQMKRLKEIGVQLAGSMALTDPVVQQDLAMTSAQKQKVKELLQKQQEANRAVFEMARSEELGFEEVRSVMEKNEKILSEQLLKVLTDTQKTKFKAMKGTPFKETDRMPGPPR